MLSRIAWSCLFIVAALVTAHLVFRPPSLDGRTATFAVEATSSTTLGRIAFAAPAEPGPSSGIVPLLDGTEAFAARVGLIRTASSALDVQYYIWQRDATGLILLDELRKAADRGVRVRLLIDDNGISGMDDDLAAIDALPNVEVRLFNPFILRTVKSLGYVFDFVRLNRRMHNKSLTADGAVSILGGRNIGDIYFGFGDGLQFIDTDVMVAGKAAADIGKDFGGYWESGSSHPIDRLVNLPEQNTLGRLIEDAERAATSTEGRLYSERLLNSDLVRDLAAGRLTFERTEVVLVSDDPAKGLGEAADEDLLFPQLMASLSRPTRSVDLVSAYFIPGREFTEALQRLASAGLRVRILTNSHAATDVPIVHSAYAKYRSELLRSGVEVYELKPEYAVPDESEGPDIAKPSRASLHSKTLAVDGERIFIGSFNFDPRSAFLNTEMGVIIDSPGMAGALDAAFSEHFRQRSYVPELTATGEMVWHETTTDGTRVRHLSEPGTNAFSRLLLWMLGKLPIEWLL